MLSGDVLVAAVPYRGTGMTGWQAVVAERGGSASSPPSSRRFSLSLTRTHGTHGNLGENFRRAARRRGILTTVEKFEPGSSATYFTARHGDSALSPGFDDAYRSASSPREC